MSGSPRQFPEEQNIFVAIPPPLVPLARQLGSSHDSSSTHLPTPISTNNSSASQSYAHWTLDNQYQRANAAPQGSSGGPEFAVLGSRPEPSVPETYARPPIAFLPPMDSTSLADSYTRPQRTQLVSPPVANMPTQLLNRLYSFSTVSNSTSTPSSISPPPRTSGSGSAPNSGSYFPPNAVVGGTASNAHKRAGYGRIMGPWTTCSMSKQIWRRL
ncbi:hypothetical protein BC939DRAFT_267806 [Gamsiella multidivaricata]|uniref:uncharacterized protein n=1 Tax=Gamsiella multidivaricata TaxID=101098 RepID=UPI00221E93F6|nr:uncharacterized protein BC939DRAFT_267806 [Gamsiella multidivaricata]KAI7819212.1 hypothetical protein BC939DRAFT_267806 [Gamsiella multidivaricata]